MNIKICRIKPKNYAEVISMIRKTHIISFAKLYPARLVRALCNKYNLKSIKERCKIIDYFITIETESNKIIGIIGLEKNQIRIFFVDPIHQGKGIGKKLFLYAERLAKRQSIKSLFLEASPVGEPIYKHLGFNKLKNILKEKDSIQYTDAYMKKDLDKQDLNHYL